MTLVAGAYSEDALVEQPTMALLRDLGWETASGYGDRPGGSSALGRASVAEPILGDRLRLALRSVNPGVGEAAIEQAVVELGRDRSAMQPIRANHEMWKLLRDGFDATVENFTVFQEQPGGLVKKIAKNHQYLGVNNAPEAPRQVGDDPGRLGVFWHTQGSARACR